MPIFEYRCLGCGKKFSHLTGMLAEEADPACPGCGGTELKKLFSRFATMRSQDEDFGEDLEDSFPDEGGDEDAQDWDDEGGDEDDY